MTKIKLFKIDELNNGTQRFQSQLMLGKKEADFVMGNDGIMKYWIFGNKGLDFYPYNKEYEIVIDINEMNYQQL